MSTFVGRGLARPVRGVYPVLFVLGDLSGGREREEGRGPREDHDNVTSGREQGAGGILRRGDDHGDLGRCKSILQHKVL